MALESKVHAEVGLNTRRLSAMIESFHDSNDDEFLFVRRSDSNSPLREEDIQAKQAMQSPPPSPSRFPKRSSTNSTMSPLKSSSTMSNYSHHKDSTIESISSEYTASIHEGLPISYVVAKNSVKDIRYDSKAPQLTLQDDRRHSLALGAHARVEDNYKFPPKSSSPTRKSLRLVPSQQLSHRKASSLGSYSIGSDFAYSRPQAESCIRNIGRGEYMRDSTSQEVTTTPTTLCGDARYSNGDLVDIKEEQLNPELLNPNATLSPLINDEKTSTWPKQSNDSRSTSHSLNTTPLRVLRNGSSTNTQRSDSAIAESAADTADLSSLASSIVPSLKTNVLKRQQSGMLPDRSVTADYQPSIPARSKNRPKSALLLHQGLENIQKELEKEMAPQGDATAVGHSRNTSTSTATKSENYFSASDQPVNMDIADDTFSTFTTENVQYRPSASALIRGDRTVSNTTITRKHQSEVPSTKRIETVRTERIRRSAVPLDDEDEWEDENIYVNGSNESRESEKHRQSVQPTPQQSPARSSQHKSKHDSKSSKRKSIRSMDVDTISHLLNATKGTLVGSEFTNLGIRPEEKRALERLVDSLSRLTADMIVDPERYAEGLKRLDKATKALDGF